MPTDVRPVLPFAWRRLAPSWLAACALALVGAAQEPEPRPVAPPPLPPPTLDEAVEAPPTSQPVPTDTQADAQAQSAPAEAPDAAPTGPRVLALRFEGYERYGEEQLAAALGLELGEPLDADRLERGVEELWRSFRARAQVHQSEVPGGVELLVRLNEMPVDLEPRFVGNVKIQRERLLEWALLSAESQLFLSDVERVRQRLENGYRSQGFYFAQVRIAQRELVSADGTPQAPDVIFEILEGPRVKVRDVHISGNDSMPDGGFLFWKSGLRDIANVRLSAPSFLIFRDDFVEEDLEADLQAMRQVYRDRGHLDAIVELARLEFNAERDRVAIHIEVDEGPLYRVSQLDLVAVEEASAASSSDAPRYTPAELIFPLEELQSLLLLAPGKPYAKLLIDKDRALLRDHYGSRGYLAHPSLPAGQRFDFAEPDLVFDVEKKEVAVTYRIAQGRQQFVRELLFSGPKHTQDRVMRRLVDVHPGEVADLKEIQRGLNRLRGTGYFSDPQRPFDHPEPSFRFRETSDPAWKDIEFVLEEGRVVQFDFAVGAGGNYGVFGKIGLSMRNVDISRWPDSPWTAFEEIGSREALHGAGQELNLIVQPGSEISSYRLRFREPDLFMSHIERISLELEAERVQGRRGGLFDLRRDEAGFRLGRQLEQDTMAFVGYRFGTVDVSDLDEGGEPSIGNPLAVPQLLKDQEGTSDVAYLELGVLHRTLNSAFNPSEGESIRSTLELSESLIGSDYDFGRWTTKLEHYGLFGDPSQNVRRGYFLALDLGVAVPYGDTDDVPYTERFQLGGASTLRGFRYFGVGPNENGDPIGGESMLAATLELRQPLLTSPAPGTGEEREVLRGILFLDLGILDPDPFQLDLEELRASVGFGVGFSVPLPIGISFGFPVRKGDGDDERAFNLSLGNF